MKFLCLFIFLGSVLSSMINLTDANENIYFADLIAEIELNILLVNHLIHKGDQDRKLTVSLINLKHALNNFADSLYKPEVMKPYCGKMVSKDPVFTKLMNKYQRDTCDPFVEAVKYKALDVTKFSISFDPNSITVYSLKRKPTLLAEFDSLIDRDVNLFDNPHRNLTEGKCIRNVMKGKLEKYMIRIVRRYVQIKGIDASDVFGYFNGVFDLAVSIYVNNGKV